MSLNAISVGSDIPTNVNVIIEIPANASPIKYEVDKETNSVWVDRFMSSPMFYPANYGYLNNTLAEDGDPVDVLVIAPYPLMIGSIIKARPIGVLMMSDDGGNDAKVVAVPVKKLTPLYNHVEKVEDIPLIKEQIEHFFKHYKELEPGKWVNIDGWADVKAAHAEIESGINRYNAQNS